MGIYYKKNNNKKINKAYKTISKRFSIFRFIDD